MASKGRRGTAVPVAVEEPPEREVIPGKITESQWYFAHSTNPPYQFSKAGNLSVLFILFVCALGM